MQYEFADSIGNNSGSKLSEIHNKWKKKMKTGQFLNYQSYSADKMFTPYAQALDAAKYLFILTISGCTMLSKYVFYSTLTYVYKYIRDAML